MLVLGLNHPPFIAGLVTCAAIMPSMLAYIPAGGLVDRWDPWRVMLVSEILRGVAVVTVVISLLVLHKRVSIYLLIIVMVAEEILEIFWMLADRRLMSQLIEQDHGGKVVGDQASIEVRSHATVLAGRPLGPFLFTLGQYLPFLADFVSFVCSVVVLVVLGRGRKPVASDREWRLWREIGEGFQWLWRDRRALSIMGLMSLTTLVAQALIMMFLAEAHDNNLSAAMVGVVLAASGAGGAIGAVAAKKLPGRIEEYFMRIQLIVWSIALAMLALTGVRFPWCIAIVMLILGFTGSISNIEFGAYLVLKADGKLARVTSIGQVMAIGASGIGPLVGGAAIQDLGINGAVALFLGLVIIGTVVAFCTPTIYDAKAEGAAVAPVMPPAGPAAPNAPVEVQAGSGPANQDIPASPENIFTPTKQSTIGVNWQIAADLHRLKL
jgi:MFS family permease